MTTTYEFVVEQIDPLDLGEDDPDIYDTSGFDTMEEARKFKGMIDNPSRICLRRDTGNDVEGLIDRYYAYVTDSKLQEQFESCVGAADGPMVPKRFLKMDWSGCEL